MKAKWFIGLGLMLAVLLGIGFITSTITAEAKGNGPGGRNNISQPTPGSGTGNQTGPGSGMGMGNGRGNGVGNGTGQCCTMTPTTSLSESSVEALNEAIQEEYLARATYQAIVTKFGNELPFVNILRSENQHVNVLAKQFTMHSLPVPADNWAGKVTAPGTLEEAFTAAIALEKEDAALYDTLLKQVSEPELTRVFTNLQNASLNMHLKSLEYYNK